MPSARLLDVSRLVSRAGRVLTGVDRVEAAYLRALLAAPEPLFGLVRTPLGYLLLDEAGLRASLPALVAGADWGRAGPLARLTRPGAPERAAAEATLRRRAIARAPHARLASLLTRRLPHGTACLLVGHTGLTEEALSAMKSVPGAIVTAFIHDTIPLDHPEYCRPGTAQRFTEMLAATAAHADLILTSTGAAATSIRRRLPVPLPVRGVPLGVDLAPPEPLPDGLSPTAPYFIAIGTLEPRKNLGLLLDVWEELAERPQLYLCGTRGWENPVFFARLDEAPAEVIERPGLTDGQLATLLSGARALLMPSLAEGFGLPAHEALARGVPVVALDLPVWRESLGDRPVYLRESDAYQWRASVSALAADAGGGAPPYEPPDWASHFKVVLSMT
ncbi:glycosyltransferase [Pseudoroseicyclus tamaricis]|uniref:Glycosyltransferase family 4 protein n=1 Tax=Pseudoroseicyclus tamaricis TaxID=2705421 RepID=A0A6B2K1H8_9RHOB|nr:glycosyltransferase [Pseudoroseicyclus tamaricis]NDV02849.1 glycosyltransferase family 4 protein [Pseudoroseicyclus tamaricis]